MSRLFIVLLAISLVASSSYSQSKKEKKELKAQKEAEEFQALKHLIESNSYEFRADWANPNRGGRISLHSNPNYLTFMGEQVRIYLPYFGVAHTSSAAFSGNNGIIFEGSISNYEVKINEKKQQMNISFRCHAQKETLDFTLTIFPSGNSRLNASSSIREGIKYEGKTSSIQKVDEK